MQNTTLCYIEKDGAYLMLHRTKKEHDINKDKWIGIGGHCEENESPEDCILREAKEETGLTLTEFRYAGIITFVTDDGEGEYMHLFHATSFTGTLAACNEGDLQWVPVSNIMSLPHWQGDEIFLSLMQRRAPFFSLKLVYEHGKLRQAVLNARELPLT
jgi:8-oxo-dGTP diphosphatase